MSLPQRTADFTRAFVYSVAAFLLFFALVGCNSTGDGGGLPAVAALNITSTDGTQLTGTVRYDGNTFLAYGVTNAQAELWLKANGMPILGPVVFDERSAYLKVNKPSFKWKGDLTQPFPAQARVLFRESEIAFYQLPFAELE